MPVRDHIQLLNSQYLVSVLQQSYPSHSVVTSSPGLRNMKHTLHSKYYSKIECHLTDNITLEVNYKRTISSLHTAAVSRVICNAGPNEVLGLYPPAVDPSEETLSRRHRTTLHQLRSGKCIRLNTLLHKFGRADSSLCPGCNLAVYMTKHLFEFPKFPTDLTLIDMWCRPREVAIFISSLPSFIHFLPPVPPIPFQILLVPPHSP
jgi:hypothetical protein